LLKRRSGFCALGGGCSISQNDDAQINGHEPTPGFGEQVTHRSRKEIHGHLVVQHALAVPPPQPHVYRVGVTESHHHPSIGSVLCWLSSERTKRAIIRAVSVSAASIGTTLCFHQQNDIA